MQWELTNYVQLLLKGSPTSCLRCLPFCWSVEGWVRRWAVGGRQAGRERRGGGNLVKQQSLGAEGVDEGMQGRRVGLNEWESLSGLAFHTKAVPFPPSSYFLKGRGGGRLLVFRRCPLFSPHINRELFSQCAHLCAGCWGGDMRRKQRELLAVQ